MKTLTTTTNLFKRYLNGTQTEKDNLIVLVIGTGIIMLCVALFGHSGGQHYYYDNN